MTRVHAFTDDALADLDGLGVAARIASGEVSREEVLEAAIARVQKVNPQLNAVQVEAFDRARTVPAGQGPFAGVPSFIKDNVDVAGLPTCHGSAAFDPHPAKQDGGPARQFLAQGFALLGKTTMPEFGLTASTEYADREPTRNPWDTQRSVGGSSGGTAALVASGAVPLAHGNDGGGSIRIPAAINGLVGLKPTRLRMLDQPGVRQLPVNLIGEGVLTRTVRDTAHYVAGAERFAPAKGLKPIGLVEGPSDRRLRIGLVEKDVLGRTVHPDVQAVLDSAAQALEKQGHEVVPFELLIQPQFVDDFKRYWAMLSVLVSASSKAAHPRGFHPNRLDPFTKGLARMFTRAPHRSITAIRRLRTGTALYERHFESIDVVLSPVLAQPAPVLGDHRPDQPFAELFDKLVDYVAFTPINNVGGGPGISIPHGLLSDGLPGSVQASAPAGDERTLLEIAYELEAVAPFPRIQD